MAKELLGKRKIDRSEIFQIMSVSINEDTSVILSNSGVEYTVPFLLPEHKTEVELIKRENNDGTLDFSLIYSEPYKFRLNEKKLFKVENLEIKNTPTSSRYIIRILDENNNLFTTDVRRSDYINIKKGDELEFNIRKIYPRRIFFSLIPPAKNIFISDLDYTFDVVDKRLTKKGQEFAVFKIEFSKSVFELIVPYWQFHYYDQFKKVVCRINSENRPSQVFTEVEHPFFEKGKGYNFTFIKYNEKNPEFILVKGVDACIYSVKKPFLFHQKELVPEQNVRLIYRGINEENGTLLFKFFVQFEDVVQDFRALKRITFDAFKKEVKDDDANEDSFLIKKLYKDYDNIENIWIISFCEVLRNKINKTLIERDFEESLIFIDVLIKFEDWILCSGFLNTFSNETKFRTEQVALIEIDSFRKEAKALELILDNKDEKFIDTFLNILKTESNQEELVLNTYIMFYLLKHKYIEDSVLSNNRSLELILLIGQKNVFKKDNGLFQIVTNYFDRLRNIFEKKLFHRVFIKSEKRREFYTNNEDLLRYIQYSYLNLNFHCDENSRNAAFIICVRLFKLIGHYKGVENDESDIFSKALRLAFLNPDGLLDTLKPILKWTIEVGEILNWGFLVNDRRPFKNIIALQNSLNNVAPIEARVTGNSLLGYELMYREDLIMLPYFNTYKKLKRGETVRCIIYELDVEYSQALARIENDKTLLPPIEQLEVGSVLKGIVKRIESYGAFVTLGKKDGLIPLKEISKNFINKIGDFLDIGDIVEVEVLDISKHGDIEKITLSRKAVINSRWKDSLQPGIYQATITTVHETYGLFLETETGHTGLVRPDEVSWNYYGDLAFIFSEGQKIMARYLFSNGENNYFSLKKIIADPFKERASAKGVFSAKIFGLVTFENWLKFFPLALKPISTPDTQSCFCPYCYEKSLYRRYLQVKLTNNRTIMKRKDERFWQCTNCGFYQNEAVQLWIQDLKSVTYWPLLNLSNRDYYKITRQLSTNDEMQVAIKKIDQNKRKILVDVNFQTLRRTALKTEIQPFEKSVNFEIAGCYEVKGFMENNFERKLQYLSWSRYYYAASKSAKSYYLNAYINYIEILSGIVSDDNLDNIVKYVEKINTLITDMELENNSIEIFPVIDKILTLLRVLSHYGSKREDSYKYLLSVSLAESFEHDYIKDIATSILTFNLQGDTFNEYISTALKGRIIASLKSSLISFESFDIDNEVLKKRVLLKSLIEKGEKIDIEFKATLHVPVISKNIKIELRNIKHKLMTENSAEKINELNKAFNELNEININDRFVIEKVNFSSMKTIAAFANTIGGYLVIGIDEDADGKIEVIGLRPDYMKFKTQDGVLLKLDELIQRYFGNTFNNLLISFAEFITLDDKDVLLIQVKKSEKPIFMNVNNDKKFFVRRQASTVELSTFEMYEYIQLKESTS